MIPASANPLFLSTDATGYNLTRSLRFRASASANMSRTPSVTGNRQKWTLSTWVKRGSLGTDGTYHRFFSAQSGTGGARFFIGFEINTDSIGLGQYNGTSYDWSLVTTGLFRDPSNWYHIVLAIDTTQATASNRLMLYVNGVQITSFSSITYPTLNSNTYVNTSGNTNRLGSDYNGTALTALSDCYLAETNFVDGQQLTPSSFGSTNSTTGVWQPAKYTGTYGTNGFYLPFTDNSALTTSSNVGLGKDFSGNGNYWVTNNISITSGVTYDSMTDVPTLTGVSAANFAVLSPLSTYNGGGTLSNGNLSVSLGTIANNKSTIGVSTGKFYSEITCVSNGGYSGTGLAVSSSGPAFGTEFMRCAYCNNGQTYNFNTSSYVSYGASWTSGDVIGVAFDCDNKTVEFFKNGVSQGVLTTPSIGTGASWTEPVAFIPTAYNTGVTSSFNVNFGQRPFSYTPPTGFKALNTFNLPDPTIKKPNQYMDVITYTGDGTTSRTITNSLGFTPDLAWGKSRSAVLSHALVDSVRGNYQTLSSNTNYAESAINSYNLSTADSLITWNANETNQNGATYVAWCWKKGATPGFDIVTYTGNGTAGSRSISHSLGVAPKMLILKGRNTASSGGPGVLGANDWYVWHTSLGNQDKLLGLNSTAATQSSAGWWGSAIPSSSAFTVNGSLNSLNQTGNGFVAYLFAEIAGFSKFGSYTGNGSADGTFVYTGIRSRWLLIRRVDSVGNWVLHDTGRDPYNTTTHDLYPNLSDAEAITPYPSDILSNGFKLRGTGGDWNASGGTYIYMAFAENPFKNALAR